LLKSIALSLAAVAVVAALPASALACEGLVDGPVGTVVEVTDGDTIVLDTGVTVRMIGTQAPKLPLGREGFEVWPMAHEAKAALEALVLGREVIVRHGGEREDRYGRVLGHVFLTGDSGTWLQLEMVASGLARVYSFPDNRKCLPELFAAETKARTMGLGIWTDPYYSLRQADQPASVLERQDHYELVEGKVLLADEAGGRIFLNFGTYWKEDFTIVMENAALGLFEEAGLDPLVLEGALVRVRGWVDDRDGPRIEVTHPEQIEVLLAQ
jgi:endonuclease YncB( thermonuclease family)